MIEDILVFSLLQDPPISSVFLEIKKTREAALKALSFLEIQAIS